jgi:O-antigen/teichoic acid export membrane protein
LHGVARGASARFSGLAFDKLMGYVFALLVAKTYGSGAFGVYFFGVGLFEIGLAISELGLERAVIRDAAGLEARQQRATVGLITRTTMLLTLPSGLLLSALLIAGADEFALLFDRPDLASFLVFGALAIPASLIADAFLWPTEGLGRQRYAVLVRMVAEPVVKTAAAALLFLPAGKSIGAGALGLSFAVAMVASAVIGALVYRRVVGSSLAATGSVRETARQLLAVGLPLCGLVLLNRLLNWADVFLLFWFASPSATGHYGVASRTALLTTMIAAAFDAAFRPRVAASFITGSFARAADEYLRVSRVVLMLCLPACVMLAVFPHKVMPVLGDQFQATATVVALISLGTLASFFAGPAASALTMAGRSRIPLATGLLAGGCGVALSVVLIPRWGILGAGVSQCLVLTVSNGLNALAAWRILGLRGIGRSHWKLLAAAAAAMAGGLAADQLAVANKYIALAATGGAVVGLYGLTLVVLRVEAVDVRNIWKLVTGNANSCDGSQPDPE